jgi:hypothetical protein
MAWDPCVSCGKSFHGPTTFTYVTWHLGEARLTYRLRQCTSCSADLRNNTSERGDRRGDDGNWVRSDLVEPAQLKAVK